MKKYKYDLFGKEIPRFHLDGHEKIGTSIGCCLTVLLGTLMATYFGFRVKLLLTGDRPNISSYTVNDERKGTELVDLNEKQFKVAFSVQNIDGSLKGKPINDPDFVEWYAYIGE